MCILPLSFPHWNLPACIAMDLGAIEYVFAQRGGIITDAQQGASTILFLCLVSSFLLSCMDLRRN